MNTNEIPIKLPERYTRGDDRFHVIHEDDINDDSKEGEKNIPLIVLSFFLSFFRAFVRISSIGEKDFGGKQNRTRNVSVLRRLSLSVARMSLSFGLFRRDKTERRRFCRSFSRMSYRDDSASFPTQRFFRTHNTCVLKYLIEHNILNRNKRSVGRGDETHHETDQRNEPV